MEGEALVRGVLRRAKIAKAAVPVYAAALVKGGFDSCLALRMVTAHDLAEAGFKKGHAKLLLKAIQSVRRDVDHVPRTPTTPLL